MFNGPGLQRRWPVYLLLDCSAAMQGTPIIALNEGVEMLYRELMSDPQTRQSVWISCIRFANMATQDPLVPLDQFVPPTLSVAQNTEDAVQITRQSLWNRQQPAQLPRPKPSISRLDYALTFLSDSIRQDIRPNSAIQRGDYRPLVFLLTNGQSTDTHGAPSKSYRTPLMEIKNLTGNLRPTLIALGCGRQVDAGMLRDITDNVLLMISVTSDRLREFFRIVSGSIVSASRAASSSSADASPPPPAGFTYDPSDEE